MKIEDFPAPRVSAEHVDNELQTVVLRILDELQSYQLGIPLNSIIDYLASDYDNWRDILRAVLEIDEVSVVDGVMHIENSYKSI